MGNVIKVSVVAIFATLNRQTDIGFATIVTFLLLRPLNSLSDQKSMEKISEKI